MRKRLAVIVLVGSLSACAGAAEATATWELPHAMSTSQYESVANVALSATDRYAVVAGDDSDGIFVTGYNLESEEELWRISVGNPTECTAKNNLALCSTMAAQTPDMPFIVSLADGQHEFVNNVFPNFYATEDFYYVERLVLDTQDLVELVKIPASVPPKEFLKDAQRVATLNTETGEVDALGNNDISQLDQAGELAPDSHWHGRVPPVPHASFLADGFMTMSQAGNETEAGTGVVLYDESGTKVDSRSIDATLHYTDNPSWTLQDMGDILDRAEMLARNNPHVMIFQGGQTLGFEQKLTSSVAPAYANIESYGLSNGVTLDFSNVAPETQMLWAYQYPFVSMSGVNDDGVVARTYNVETGSMIIDGKKCQWQHDLTLCFDEESISKVDFE